MNDVFISYKKEDFEVARRFVTALEEHGLSVWWDDNLTARTAWDAALEKEIATAAAVVVLWTPHSVDSEWVRTEAHYGQERGKLVPVMAEACTLPLAFLLRQTVDLSGWQGERDHRQWRKLLAWITDLVAAARRSGDASPAASAAQSNPNREIVGRLSSGEPIVDGTFVNAATPAGTAFRDGAALPAMRILPPGAFLLGSPASDPDRAVVEGPQRRVEIPLAFAMGVFPVLVSEYQAAMGARPVKATAPARERRWNSMFSKASAPAAAEAKGNPLIPITEVSFEDAQAFVGQISSASGAAYRLPSEAEWEYACRAGSRGRYSFGDMIDQSMACFGASAGPIVPGFFRANAFGLHDMHGNVREWTADLWHESYDSTPLDGSPATEGHSSMRVVRGGGWSDSHVVLRSAARMRATHSIRSNVIGFRVARAVG